jgi:CheY-like chemotaxis protein
MAIAEILVVDDDADIRDSLRFALELEGYAVETASNGEEGWRRLRSDPAPALVLLDLAMPVLDGAGLLALIRGDPRLRRLPVLLITAFGSLAGAVCAQADGCLHKPIDLDALLAVVARHCHWRATASLP